MTTLCQAVDCETPHETGWFETRMPNAAGLSPEILVCLEHSAQISKHRRIELKPRKDWLTSFNA